MEAAAEWLRGMGYRVTDKSGSMPFDLLAESGEEAIKVEVKGTTADTADQVLMTRNEVQLHKAESGRTGLIIVSGINLDRTQPEPAAAGGTVEALVPWDIRDWVVEALSYSVSRGSD